MLISLLTPATRSLLIWHVANNTICFPATQSSPFKNLSRATTYVLHNVDHRDFVVRSLRVPNLIRDQRPELVQVQDGTMELVFRVVEKPHTLFTEVARVTVEIAASPNTRAMAGYSRTHNLSKWILWWCCPPALPRPPGCLRFLTCEDRTAIKRASKSNSRALTYPSVAESDLPAELSCFPKPCHLNIKR